MGNAHPESMCPAPEHTQCRHQVKDEGSCDTQSQEEFFSIQDLDSTTDEEYLDPGTLQAPDSGESIDMGANTSCGSSPSAPTKREKQEATPGPSSRVPSPQCPEQDQATCGIEESSHTGKKTKNTTQSHVQITTGSLGEFAQQKPGLSEKPPHKEGNIVCDERILEERAGTDEEQAHIYKEQVEVLKRKAGALEERAGTLKEQAGTLEERAGSLKERASTLEERAGNDKEGDSIRKERVWVHKIQVGFFEKTAGTHEEQAGVDKVQDGIRKKWNRIRKEWDCIRKTETLKQPPSHRTKKTSSKPTRESDVFLADLAEEILSKSTKSPARSLQSSPCSKDNQPPEPPLSQDERQAQGQPKEPLGSDASARAKKPPHSEVNPASGTSRLQTPATTQAHVMPPSNDTFVFQSGGVGGPILPTDGLRVSHCSNPSPRQSQSVKKKQVFKNSPRKKLQSYARSSSPGSSFMDSAKQSPCCPSRVTRQEGETAKAGIAFPSSPTLSGAVNTDLPKDERFFKMTAENGEQIHRELQITMVDKSCQTSQGISQSKPSSAKPKKCEKRRKAPGVPSATLQTPRVSSPEGKPPSKATEPSKTPSWPCLELPSTREEHGDFKRETHDPLTKHNGEDLDSLRHPVPERLQHPPPKNTRQKLKKVHFARTNKPPVSSGASPVRDEGLSRSSQPILAVGFPLINTSPEHKGPVQAPIDAGTKPSQRLPKNGVLLVEENPLIVNKIARGDPVGSQAVIPKAKPPCRKPKASSRTFRHKLGVQQAVENQSVTKDRLTPKHPADQGKTSPTEQVHPSITDDTSGGNHQEEPEQEQKPNQRWESFHVDTTCGRKTQRKTNLPPNVTAWRNVSQNWLSEPVWITTMKLASSLVVGTKLCLDHFELQAAERARETKERRA